MAETGGLIFPVTRERPFETWQVGAVRLDVWVKSRGGEPRRAWVALCVSWDTGRVVGSETGAEEEVPALLAGVVSRAARKWRTCPARVQVTEVAWGAALEERLAPQGVEVEVRSELPELRKILEGMPRRLAEESHDPRPGALTGAGVTVERLAALARAADSFVAAPGWRHLAADDLLRIEAPNAEATLGCATLSHSGDSSIPQLTFFAAREQLLEDLEEDDVEDEEAEPRGAPFDDGDDGFEAAENGGPKGVWLAGFQRPWEAAAVDLELWEREGLPWVGDGLVPFVAYGDRDGFRRPDARQLAFFEGFFAALAATTEADLDTGRWEKQVVTADGEVRFVLSLPDLLEPPPELPPDPGSLLRLLERSLRRGGGAVEDFRPVDIEVDGERGILFAPPEPPPAETPREHAEELLEQAHRAKGRRVVHLARQALEIWPDCAGAYTLMARRAPDLEAAARLYELGMAAGERAMGPEAFAAAGRFWEVLETRPYLRARSGLANVRAEQGRFAEAVEHFQEMLRLNPGDNLSVRHSLVSLLIALGREEEAWRWADHFAWDDQALMEFPRALLRFRKEGDSPAARKALKAAIRANRFVPGMLLGAREVPPEGGFYSPGGEDEAGLCVELALDTWAATEGALDWLRKRTALPPRPTGKRKGKGKKKRRR